MSHIAKERLKLLNRMKRIRGQMETIERTLGAEEHECADVLMLLAAVRGGFAGAPRTRRAADRPTQCLDCDRESSIFSSSSRRARKRHRARSRSL